MSKKRSNKKTPTHGANREWAESVARRTNAVLRDMPLPEGKVSDIVAEFAQPLVAAFGESNEDHVRMLAFACNLWNLAIVKKLNGDAFAKLETMAMNILTDAPFFLRPDAALNVLSAMFDRWEQDFSWCRRLIVDKHIVIEKDRIHISVASSPIGEQDDYDAEEELEELEEMEEMEDGTEAGGGK